MIISFLAVQLMNDTSPVLDSISSALRSGDSNQISQYLGSSVDVTILDFHGFVDKETTSQQIRDFFSDKTIAAYRVIHKGKSKGKESVYTIGELSTDKGKYQVYMFISEVKGKYVIQEIKIEE